MGKRIKHDGQSAGIYNAPPAPETLSDIQGELSGVALVFDPVILRVAYEAFAVNVEGGSFPAWDELPKETKALYRDCMSHVVSGNEPRTDFERTLAQILADTNE